MVTSSIDAILRSSSFVDKVLSMDKRMPSLFLLTCRRGITWTSLRVCLGWLKCMGTDSSMLFSMPRLCSPKRSLNVQQVWPMY